MPFLTPSKKGIVFRTKNHDAISKLFPEGSYILKPGMVVLPFKQDTTKILTNVGANLSDFQVIDHNYKWPLVKMTYEMYPHAKETTRRIVQFERGFVLNEPRLAKAQNLKAPVFTPQGWRQIGTLKVGDYVIGADGKPKKVNGVYPQGVHRTYRVSFRDGTGVDCNLEHLWQTGYRSRCAPNGFRDKVLTTKEIIERGITKPNKSKGDQYKDGCDRVVNRSRFYIPLCSEVELETKTQYIDPYTLGVILGDGCITNQVSCTLTLNKDFNLSKLVLCDGDKLSSRAGTGTYCNNWGVVSIKKGVISHTVAHLRSLGLQGCSSHNKFIPKDYLLGSTHQRKEILQGLLDTDGHKRSEHTWEYSSASKKLSQGVASIARSLGLTVVEAVRPAGYRKKNVWVECAPAYTVEISSYKKRKGIVSITDTGVDEEHVCISVEDELYLTEGYNVTHNTSSIIAGGDFLQQQGLTKSVLIIAPLSTLSSVWEDEIRGMMPQKTVGVLHHKSKTGEKRKAYVRDLLAKQMPFYVINPDGVKLLINELLKAKKDGLFNCLVIDESTEFGNPSTAKWAVVNELAKELRYLWMLTGTPGGPDTVYGQAKMMNPSSVPSRKDIWRTQTQKQVSEYKWIPRPEAEFLIRKVLTPAVRFKKRQVFKDMPEELVIPMKTELTSKQKLVMNTLTDDKGMILNGVEVIPANAAVLANKLNQIASGTLILDDKKKVRLPVDHRFNTLLQIMSESEHKSIIFANNTETIDYLKDLLEDKKIKSLVVDGRVAANKRPGIFKSFMNDPEYQVIICHPKTVSYGVEMAAADKAFFWGVPTTISAFLYQQAKERIYSLYQKSDRPAIYQLYSTNAEKRAFANLEAGVDWQTNVSDTFNEIISGDF